MRVERFVINNKEGHYIASVYAERFEWVKGVGNSFTGARCGHFWIGDSIIASIEDSICAEPFTSGYCEYPEPQPTKSGFTGVLELNDAEWARFEEAMNNPGEPTEATKRAAKLIKELYGD